ncbi:MAG TPA: hypothetical protein ENI23_00590 [bacterium]|nr:hypothetical protein [bacterium]
MSFVYSDLDETNPDRLPHLLGDIQAIYQSIFNILNTNVTERIFNPEHGNRLEELLFEPIDEDTALAIFQEVTDSLERQEERITVNQGLTKVTPIDEENRYELLLVFDCDSIRTDRNSFEFTGSLQK